MPKQCCLRCPNRFSTDSGLYRHRGRCKEYQKYTAARQTLCQQLELEATNSDSTVSKRPRTFERHSPQHEREGLQLIGPVGGNEVMVAFPQTGPSSRHPPSPTPPSPSPPPFLPSPPSPPPPPDHDIMVFPQIVPSPSHPQSPDPLDSESPSLPLPPCPASPRPALSQSGRPLRNHRLPARYQDIYPEPPHPAASSSSPPTFQSVTSPIPGPSETAVVQRVTLIVRNRFRTAPNTFGLWKEYLYRPSYDPDAFISPEDLHHPHASTTVLHEDSDSEQTEEAASVYSNKSSELLMNWQNSYSINKSNEETTRLVHSVLLHPQFRLDDLVNFNATKENRKADKAEEKSGSFLRSFRHASISIDVPSGSAHEASQTFSISGLYYRQITSLIKETFESPISMKFHLSPYKLFRKFPNREESDRVYSEIYDSDVLLDEHDKVQRAPTDDPTCKREKVVAALMFWSDVTHLATFGTAKLWPIYMLFGNLSKYLRCQPNSGATKHLAYIPSLPDSLQDQLKLFHHKWGTQQKDILTHCRRELMHAVWNFILDDDFLHAYTYGMVVRSPDGVERRVYPRILTYSADYPEKCVFSLYFSFYRHSPPVLGCYSLLFAIRACVHARVV